jgi:hypothetical protein
MIRYLILTILFTFKASAGTPCNPKDFFKSTEAKERLESLIERSKNLALSKLEDLGIEENQVDVKVHIPADLNDKNSQLDFKLKSTNLVVEGAKISFNNSQREEGCGMEVIVFGGHLLNKSSSKDFGNLGKLKEFIRYP